MSGMKNPVPIEVLPIDKSEKPERFDLNRATCTNICEAELLNTKLLQFPGSREKAVEIVFEALKSANWMS